MKKKEVQKKLNYFKKIYPAATLDFLKEQLGYWLDTLQLGFDKLQHKLIKRKILDNIKEDK